MIEATIHFIEKTLVPLGSWGVFFGSIIEEIIAPIPSTAVLLGAGFFLVQHEVFSGALLFELLVRIAIPAAAGVTLGSLLVYWVSYWGGKPVLERWGRYIGVSWASVEEFREKSSEKRSSFLALFAIRAFPIVPNVVINAFCGLVRFPLVWYVSATFLGVIIRAFIYALLGWMIGDVYYLYGDMLSRFEYIGLGVGIVLSVLWYVRKAKKQKS